MSELRRTATPWRGPRRTEFVRWGALALSVVLVIFVAACAKKAPPAAAPAPPPPAAAAPAAPPTPPPPPAPAPAPPAPRALTEEELFAKETPETLNAKRVLADVFFDLDESTIRDDARGPLQKNAEYLKRWSSIRFSVEGHADERGSGEYNLALGDRRANAVKNYLVSLGISADRINAVSKGREAPFCSEHNEACWSQNRRGHFVITAK